MYAMQYEITLPVDYDMGIIRHRVATRGHLLDQFSGLGLKAYLIRERGVDGALINQYAPFYLWVDIAGMNRFLWGGGGFAGIIDSFGRPVVEHWAGVAFERGSDRASMPRIATRQTESISAEHDLIAIVNDAVKKLKQRAQLPNVHSTALAIDPKSWQLIHFTLWHHHDPEMVGTRYQVLHLSTPHMAELLY